MAGATNSKTRIMNAFQAMKAIGLTEAKVKPVLKSLLKLYDKNWEYIEAEDYRALADAIFEREEADAQENVEKTVNDEGALAPSKNISNAENNMETEAEEPERPLKRLRRGSKCGETSSANTSNGLPGQTPLLKPKDEPNELPDTQPPNLSASSHEPNDGNFSVNSHEDLPRQSSAKKKGKQPISPKASIAEEPKDGVSQSQLGIRLQTESRTPAHQKKLRGSATGSVSSEVASREKRSVPDSSSKQDGNSTTLALIKPKDEPVTDDTPCLEAAARARNPETTNDSEPSDRNCTRRKGCSSTQPVASPSMNENEKDCGAASREFEAGNELTKEPAHCSSQLDIASSFSGKVKISFIYDLVNGRPPPTLGAVIKSMEDKYLVSHQTLGAKVPLTAIMREMCEFFLNPETVPSDEIPPPTLSPFSCNDEDGGAPHDVVDDTNENSTGQKVEPIKKNAVEKRAPEIGTSLHFFIDVAKGHEKVVISLVNEVNDEPPPSFHYIPQNTAFQSACLHFSLARIADNHCCTSCDVDCLSAPMPRACAHETGREFAYTVDGLVREELVKECISMNRDPKRHHKFFCKECPLERLKKEECIEACKGHLVRKFIKECWQKCGCDKQCGNRVVQRGITRNLQVFMSPDGKGWGLRTLEDLPKGAFICEYVGEVLTNSELFERVHKSQEGERHFYPVLLDAGWSAEGVLKDEEALCLDATYYGNVGRFINHRCYDSNLVEIPVEVETPDHHYYHLAFFTTRKVKAMEELTWDYGIDFDDDDHPIKAFRCQCGSKFCRNIKRNRTRSRRRDTTLTV